MPGGLFKVEVLKSRLNEALAQVEELKKLNARGPTPTSLLK